MKLLNKKFIKIILIVLAIGVLTAAGFLFFNQPKTVIAGWWDDSWHYREAITVTNNTNAETDVYIVLTLDTNTASTSMQTDCGDFRFTDNQGKILDYYIVSGCRSANNVIHVEFSSFPAGEQTVYFYYGNATAENGFSAADFSTEASDYAIGAVGSQETGPGPVGYWPFDSGHGAVAQDESGEGNDGTITGATWQDESMCVSGKCLYFDGSGAKVEIPDFNF